MTTTTTTAPQKRSDVEFASLGPWDAYKDQDPGVTAEQIFTHAVGASANVRTWYRLSIKSKRRWSLLFRSICFILVIVGAGLPIVAAAFEPETLRLHLTQSGVAALAAAGLVFQADRIFGLSSGWLRYTTTVASIESRTQKFELDWAATLLAKSVPLGNDDALRLFELARAFEEDVIEIQNTETQQWVTEFNAGLAVLGELIRSQRESTHEAFARAKAAMETRVKASKLGALEISIKYSGVREAVLVALDAETPVEFEGFVWSRNDVAPGRHRLILRSKTNAARRVEKILVVAAGEVLTAELELPVLIGS